MNTRTPVQRTLRARRRSAVTILELLVAVSLVSFIILALYQMFDRTQSIMRKAVREVDKFETGRAAADLLKRDVAQMQAGNSPLGGAAFNFYTSTNWSAGAITMTNGSNVVLQNVLQDAFFISFDPAATPTNWMAVGYRVASAGNPMAPATNGMGSLYRWTTNANRFSSNLQNALNSGTPVGLFHRVADNVLHFRVTGVTNGVAVPVGGFLTNGDVPSHVEIELGYVDSRTADRANAFLPNTTDVQGYLSTNLDSVHMFRLQIPIRTGLQ